MARPAGATWAPDLTEPRRTGMLETDAAQGWGWAHAQARWSCAEHVTGNRGENEGKGVSRAGTAGMQRGGTAPRSQNKIPSETWPSCYQHLRSRPQGRWTDCLFASPMMIYSSPARGHTPNHTTGRQMQPLLSLDTHQDCLFPLHDLWSSH